MGYHYFTLGFLLLAQLAARNVGDTGIQLEGLMSKAFRAGLTFRQPDGSWPAIGDVDSAISIPVARENYWDFSSLHNLAAAAFDDPTIACKTVDKTHVQTQESQVDFGDDLYWLLACDGVEKWQQIHPKKESHATTLPVAGYYVAGDDRDHVLFDAGPISAGLHSDSTASVAHGHADTLQILYHFNGRSVLCDSGMPNYAGNPARAAYFRSPQAHNTVTIEGAELVRSAGVLAWSNEVPTPTLWTSKASSPGWMASGEVQWSTCRITRHLLAMPGEGLWIADWLQSDQPRVATWCWQFPLDIEPKFQSSEKKIEAIGDGVTLQAVATKDLEKGQVVSNDSSEMAGWVSPGYGVLCRAHRVSYQGQVEGSLLVLTCIGDPKMQIGFETKGQTVAFSETDATHDWQRHECGATGQWLLKNMNNDSSFKFA